MNRPDKDQLNKTIYGVIQSLDEIFEPGFIYGKHESAPGRGSWTLKPEGFVFLAGDGVRMQSFGTGKNHHDNLNVKPRAEVAKRILTYCIGEWLQSFSIITWKDCEMSLITAGDNTGIPQPWVAFIPTANLPIVNYDNTPHYDGEKVVTVEEVQRNEKQIAYAKKKRNDWSYKNAYNEARAKWLDDKDLPQYKNYHLLSNDARQAVYVGPLSALKGKTAIVQSVVAAQFDDRNSFMGGGWTLFNPKDWVIQKKHPLYRVLAQAIRNRALAIEKKDSAALAARNDEITSLVRAYLPNDTFIDVDNCHSGKLAFGLEDYQILAHPSLETGITVRVIGPAKGGMKAILGYEFSGALQKEV